MKIQRNYYIDKSGNCSDGTNMWDWSINRLEVVINTCWYRDISDLAKKILKSHSEKINKLIS